MRIAGAKINVFKKTKNSSHLSLGHLQVEYTLNFLFVALCTPLAFSVRHPETSPGSDTSVLRILGATKVTDILRRLGTICPGHKGGRNLEDPQKRLD